jgi:hypothetical protein
MYRTIHRILREEMNMEKHKNVWVPEKLVYNPFYANTDLHTTINAETEIWLSAKPWSGDLDELPDKSKCLVYRMDSGSRDRRFFSLPEFVYEKVAEAARHQELEEAGGKNKTTKKKKTRTEKLGGSEHNNEE